MCWLKWHKAKRRALLCCAIASLAATQAIADELGTYEGSGRACTGHLKITAKAINWKSSFSQCGPSRYSIVGGGTKSGAVTYHLLKPGQRCSYPFLTLHHTDTNDDAWEVVGFTSREDYEAEHHSIACPMIKLD